MTLIKCEVDFARLPAAKSTDEIHVLLYGSSATSHVGAIGSRLGEMMQRLSVPPSAASVDLVSIAMAVTAADTFVLRDEAPDGWRRAMSVDLPLFRPEIWTPLAPQLSELLGFLSEDDWEFSFRPGGRWPPLKSDVRARNAVSDPSKSDCVALFSGGLDSALGVAELINGGRKPLLVSHAATGDAMYQSNVAPQLPARMQHFSYNSYASRAGNNDISMRTRSFQFLAVAALAAQTLHSFRGVAPIDLFMCENGLIALNPPLTPRRIGSHSTRTAHPHYLLLVQRLFNSVGLPVRIVNPHRHDTKGEMLLRHVNEPSISRLASSTVSCGKWKRTGVQCGRCWPCIIRRASFHHASVIDGTHYRTSRLSDALSRKEEREDVLSVQVALRRRYDRRLKAWILQSGPLPNDQVERAAYFAVVERGMDELEAYFASQGLTV